MRRNRLTLILPVATLVVAASVTAVIAFYPGRLPNPASADRTGLLRWLVTRDLTQEPPETRQVLARRIEEEFGQGVDWAAVGKRLNDAQKEQVWSNVLVLLEPWLGDKVDGYSRLPESERPRYVDRTLELMETWKGAVALRSQGNPPGSHEKSQGLLQVFLGRIEQWAKAADPPRRKQIDKFLLDVQIRWLERNLLGAAAL